MCQDDDPDRCGFYFFPYSLVNAWWARFHGSFVTDFDLVWDAQSYAANKHKYPHLDYSLVEESTLKQNKYEFSGPFPFAKRADETKPRQ